MDPSPEEKDRKELTAKTDIWDLGVLIEESLAILERIPEKHQRALVKKMKAKKAKDRPSAQELKAVLEKM